MSSRKEFEALVKRFQSWTTKRLRNEARKMGMPGYQQMERSELIAILAEVWY